MAIMWFDSPRPPDHSFCESFNDLLRACPHHGFSELHQLDTFYNALNANDQDSLNSAAGGNFLVKMPCECFRIIESKSKVRNSRNKVVVAKVSSNSSTPGISPDVATLTGERERKARTTLLMALPEDHLAKFHKMTDAKEMWDAIKSRFGGNDESKKMHKYILKQQFEGFSVSNSEGLHKGYDRLYCIIPLACKMIALVSENHQQYNEIHEYDLEEMDLKWQVAMISMRMKKFYKKTGRKLQFDAKEPVGFDKTKVECYNCHKTGHFARECRIKGNQDNRRRDAWNSGNKDGSRTGQKEDSKALVTIDGEGVDWTNHSEDEDYALMACNSSDSDTEVISCSTKCKESYANLKKLYDAQREQLSDASIEIKAYSQGLKKVEAQLLSSIRKLFGTH
ncbi:ribonuclease H-like domain-containing protein [Tanacetum coccineum]|uniref:Ribonuclease H-like domain-containing protein n=1 Tax=Tanacetum coccineum TaxID=301880 RepID=A0ABQ5FI42_9ASTR